MIIEPIRTPKISPNDNLIDIIDQALPHLPNQSILVITSKIVSLCEGAVLKNDGTIDKEQLIQSQSDYYITDPQLSKYHVDLTITRDTLIANAGVDESNGNGYFILWPKNPHTTAATVWAHLRQKHRLTHVGVIISDSRLIPMRWGTLGFAMAWAGFNPLNNYIGHPDIYGVPLKMTKASVIDSLAAAAVGVMGEGNEQTPLARITEASFVQFLNRAPSQEDIDLLKLTKEDDVYAQLTNSPLWKRGGGKLSEQ